MDGESCSGSEGYSRNTGCVVRIDPEYQSSLYIKAPCTHSFILLTGLFWGCRMKPENPDETQYGHEEHLVKKIFFDLLP